MGGAGQPIQEGPIPSQGGPDQVGGRGVHQIPIVDAVKVFQIKGVAPAAFHRPPAPEAIHEDEEPRQPVLVVGTVKQLGRFGKRQVTVVAGDAALARHRNAQKTVAFPVLARSRFKKSREPPGFFRRGEGAQRPLNRPGRKSAVPGPACPDQTGIFRSGTNSRWILTSASRSANREWCPQ